MGRPFRAYALLAIVFGGVVAIAVPQPAAAQQGLTRVTLKSNETLAGTILKELADGGIRMILLDGTLRDIPAADIALIRRPSLDGFPEDPHPRPDPVEPKARPNEAPERSRPAEVPSEPTPKRPTLEARPAIGDEPGDDLRGWYGGGYAGAAAAPAFPGVAGVGGVEGFAGYRVGAVDVRLGLGGFGAGFPIGSLGFVTLRPEVLFWVAEPYGLGVGAGPLVGYYEDERVGGGVMGGAMFSATPVALRFGAGSALLEASLAAGAVVGKIAQADSVVARPYLLLGFAAYSR